MFRLKGSGKIEVTVVYIGTKPISTHKEYRDEKTPIVLNDSFPSFTAAVALVLVLACAAVGQAQQKLTVRLGDKTVLPCLGSVSGTWYFVDP